MTVATLALVFVCVACLVLALVPDVSKRLMRQRVLAEVARVEARPTLLSQLADILAPVNRYLPTGWYSVHVWKRLDAGGMKLLAMHFFVLQEIGAVTGLGLYCVFFKWKHLNVGWLSLFVVLGFIIPYLWLSARIQARRLSIARDLPEVVDLLSLCVDAGLDFMQSLGRIIKEFRRCPTTYELSLVIQEVRVGKRRRDALQAFSQRVQTPEARSFSRTLRQADRMGTGLGEALRILSEDIRIQRYHWAERFAQQAPLKMLIPLLFSLAAALLIVAGPIMMQFLKGGFTAPQFSAQQPRR